VNLVNLDRKTREYIAKEIDMDVKAGRLYYSRRFTQKGREDYENLLRTAVESYDPEWLADQLQRAGRMRGTETSHSRRGTPYIKRTPLGDHETAAFGEFNRFYIRGLCARAIDEGTEHLIVYRALEVAEPRSSSMAIVGAEVDPGKLLQDLRENVGKATRLGIPGGPNSGISVRLP
jgi:hypothetical protein